MVSGRFQLENVDWKLVTGRDENASASASWVFRRSCSQDVFATGADQELRKEEEEETERVRVFSLQRGVWTVPADDVFLRYNFSKDADPVYQLSACYRIRYTRQNSCKYTRWYTLSLTSLLINTYIHTQVYIHIHTYTNEHTHTSIHKCTYA